ncbi:LacI family DNA-binding transcriptional regulator [Lacibacterium aquatile]|uniref:LacI family DNA-binding transcriptional regulator n=1 Tax=Lacibacterium aquatile TaxID=1168082 RepID=A0ABW5DLY2_9PROT
MVEKTSATLSDIALKAGISVASVSKVLNNRPGVSLKVRELVWAIANQMGYAPKSARSDVPGVVSNVTIATPAEFFASGQFYEEIMRGMLDAATAAQLNANVRLLPNNEATTRAEIEDLIATAAPESLLILGLDQPEILEPVVASKIPTVLVNGMDRMMRLDGLTPDNRFGGWLATKQLIDAGHREIVHVTRKHRISRKRRLDGFQDALAEAGLVYDEKRHLIDLEENDLLEFEAGIAIDRAFERGMLDKVTAFSCCTDVIAISVLQALEARGLSVPGDYSVMGFDDVTIAHHSRPPLTTMRVQREEMGRLAVAMLKDRIADPDASSRRMSVGVELVERATIGAPRK